MLFRLSAILVLVFLLFGSPAIASTIPSEQPQLSQSYTTANINAYASNAFLYNEANSYATARNESSADAVYKIAFSEIGQFRIGTTYAVSRSFLYFDTSQIPSYATITSATLSLRGWSSVTDAFTIQVQNGQPTYPHDPLVVGDFDYNNYSGNGGTFNVASWGQDVWNTIILSDEGRGFINPGSVTKLCLRSQNDINNSAPGNGVLEFVDYYTQTYVPYLSLTYTLAHPSVTFLSAQAVRDTISNGDIALMFSANLSFSSFPTTPANLTLRYELWNGSTLLQRQTPYVLHNYGYGQTVGSFYFTASNAPAWGGNYTIRIQEQAGYFESAQSYNLTLVAGNWSSYTGQLDNQALAATYAMGLAQGLETAYGYDFWTTSDTGNVLASYGEVYFKGAIPGITGIAPSIFTRQSQIIGSGDVGYNQNLGLQYQQRSQNWDIVKGFNRIGTYIGTEGATLACYIIILACLALIIFTAWKGWGVDPGMIGSGIILTAGAVLFGGATLTVRLVMGLIVAVILFYQLYLKRA